MTEKITTEQEALTQHILKLKADLEAIQGTIKSETKAAEIARDGFDRSDVKNGVLLPELARHGVPADRQQAFNDFQRGRLDDLHDARKDIELALAEARSQWMTLHNKFRSEHAESLQVEAAQHVRDLGEKISNRQQHQRDLRQKIASITQSTAKRAALQADHDAACALAIAQGTAAPEAPQLPELPVETVAQLEGAIKLLDLQIDELRQNQQRSAAEAKALQNLVDRRKVDEFTAMIVAEAKAQGLRLGDVRDKLVEIAGPTVSAQVDASDAAAYRRELATLRPEVERLRANVATLQDGITKLTSRQYA